MKTIGITGHLGVGKSTLAQRLVKHCDFAIIELDDVRRHALWESLEPQHVLLRKQLADAFNIGLEQSFMNRELLTSIIFQNYENLQKYSRIATPVLKQDVREKIKNNSFVVWAWFLEETYTDITNSFTILVKRSVETIPEMSARQRLEPLYSSKLQYQENFDIMEYNPTQDNFNFLVDKINA